MSVHPCNSYNNRYCNNNNKQYAVDESSYEVISHLDADPLSSVSLHSRIVPQEDDEFTFLNFENLSYASVLKAGSNNSKQSIVQRRSLPRSPTKVHPPKHDGLGSDDDWTFENQLLKSIRRNQRAVGLKKDRLARRSWFVRVF
ncbi:hypothetical protein NEOLI_002505 [Neolecta irregularis DAH-3]|uniref:Uncharacterized protein n=1 Tax=Neolecta irregularis (strain DAH-3) TaxID=1198029 RepID=A0A1U7LVI3_NEOID|nr:hypothetical protein NEOLI_002505 [Neolecta irregularis DAH-3]|eukprot:OLL26686.1 hypothetical protein NEOLI_002505 [Neolecta irregularis DAH-3]